MIRHLVSGYLRHRGYYFIAAVLLFLAMQSGCEDEAGFREMEKTFHEEIELRRLSKDWGHAKPVEMVNPFSGAAK